MFNNLKNKLMNWLEINKLKQDYNKYKINNDNHKITLREEICKTKLLIIDINRKLELYDEQLELIKDQIDALNKTLESVVSLGVDVCEPTHDRSRSWAVICIEGNYNIVKFIDMKGADYRYILKFLKQFECSRRVIDSPCKQMFDDHFIW